MKGVLRRKFFGKSNEFWGFVPDPEEDPEGGSLVFPGTGISSSYCTGYACAIQRKLGKDRVQILGYHTKQNDKRVGWELGGHDFAVVDKRYIVDPWPTEVFLEEDHYGVYDLHDEADMRLVWKLYGDPSSWVKVNVKSLLQKIGEALCVNRKKQKMNQICENCEKPASEWRCPKCKEAHFCSSECWNKIKDEHVKVCSKMYEPIGHGMGKAEANKITATGVHTVRSAPDTVTITISVQAQFNETRDTEGAVRTVYEEAISNGVMKKYPQLVVERSTYSVSPVMEYPKDQRPRRVGFRARRTVVFSTQDLEIPGQVVQMATRLGGDNVIVDGVYFSLKDSDAAEMEALGVATGKAKKKIQTMARAAGVDTWTVSRISEDGYSRPNSIHYESSRSMSSAPQSQKGPDTVLTPGVIETRKMVQMEALI